MSEQPDDTTEPFEGSPPERERQPQNYYYDDGTGYELYEGDNDDDQTDEPQRGDA